MKIPGFAQKSRVSQRFAQKNNNLIGQLKVTYNIKVPWIINKTDLN